MKNKIKATYQVYIEGGIHEENLTLRQANKIRIEAEKEGWRVKVLKVVPTIIGDLSVEV